jgi:hypothetical protein
MSKVLYPFQNTSPSNLKGERWEYIPGLEDYFLVSNLGRIKRLSYERIYKNGAVYTLPERLIKPMSVRAHNNFKKDYLDFLTVRLTLNGIRYNFMLSRLVYYCFVAKFDLDDEDILILNKDNNSLNILPNNLQKTNRQVKAQRIRERGRMESPFKNLAPAFKMKQRAAIAAATSKQVTQYNLQGKRIKTYKSMADASRVTGVAYQSISMVAAGGGISSGGFVWQLGNAKTVDVKSIRQQRTAAHRAKYGQKVTQYNFNGQRIATFPSIQDAESATGVNENAIRLVLKGVYKSGKGFYFKKGYGPAQIDLSKHKFGKASMAATQSKKVKQFSLKGKLIKIHPSIKEAALSIKVTESCVIACCKGNQKTSGGFTWKYA